ncbi:MAG: septum site-determining protein MinC [Proteobacteria bacterium]|nr:septum site-determining protein MinC [Pseudomonadota bacterium]
MAVAADDCASTAFDLKSATLTAVALMLRTTDLARLADAMLARFGETPALFDHDPVVIDLSPLDGEPDATLDFGALVELLRRQRLQPVAVRGGSDGLRAAALAAGLGESAPDEPVRPAPRAAAIDPPPPPPAEPVEPAEAAQEPETVAAAEIVEPPAAPPTLTVDKPLRSGQQVYAKGGDLVVLAAVNPGAEVLADGHIHVYGPLRGRAIAGAKGNTAARIFSTCLEAELISIAGTYRTTENPLPAEVLGKPAQIRLDGDRLVFEPL